MEPLLDSSRYRCHAHCRVLALVIVGEALIEIGDDICTRQATGFVALRHRGLVAVLNGVIDVLIILSLGRGFVLSIRIVGRDLASQLSSDLTKLTWPACISG